MKNVKKAIKGIDWKLLKKQKGWLMSKVSGQGNRDNSAGLLNLLDALQDAVVADGIATEKEVFNLSED